MQKLMMQQDRLASIGRLAAGVAHEINNPMTTILTSVMLMQEDTDPNDPKYQELKTVVDETLRCSKIVTSLLDFARQMKPAKKLSNPMDIIVECIVLTKKQAEFNDVSIVESISEDLPLTNIDGDKIQQALINLTLNAIEATGPGGKVTLSAKFVPNNETFEITICDSGTGI
jgi:signal transduction histidine kinase